MFGRLAAVVAALVLASGCVATPAEIVERLEGSSVPDGWSVVPGGVPDADALAARTLAEPPEPRLGEWWRVRTWFASGEEWEGTVVLAGARGEHLLFGMPEGEFVDEILLAHFPPLGAVQRDGLAFDLHGTDFQPVRFPVELGDTWTTLLAGQEARAEVVDVDGTRATVDVLSQNWHVIAEYDAARAMLTGIEMAGLGGFELLDHGFAFEGVVVVPDDMGIAFFEFRTAGVVDLVGSKPAPPVLTVTVPDDYDTLSLALITGELFLPGTPGAYRATVTAPDGSTYAAQRLPTEGVGTTTEWFHLDDPAGDWAIELLAAGTGAAIAEGYGYKSVRIALPGGAAAVQER